MIPWIDVFGEGADEEDHIDQIDDFVVKFFTHLVSFTTNKANRIVRNSQPTPTGSFEILEKEMVWKRGDHCTASTTRCRP